MAPQSDTHTPRHPRSMPPQGPVRASKGGKVSSGKSLADVSAVEPGDTALAASQPRPERRKRRDPEMAALDPELREELENALYGGDAPPDEEPDDESNAVSRADSARRSADSGSTDEDSGEGPVSDAEEEDEDSADLSADSEDEPKQEKTTRRRRSRSPVRAVVSSPVPTPETETAMVPEPPDFLACYPLPSHENPRDRKICMLLAGIYTGRGGLANHYA